jgi:chorismate synthase
MAIESDKARLVSGVRFGRTLGTPICILVENQDHANWTKRMAVEDTTDKDDLPVTIPRPGHADLAGVAKYGLTDVRNVLERASARETVARVAAGAICKALLAEVGVQVRGRVTRIGSVVASENSYVDPNDVDWNAVEESAVACAEGEVAEQMCAAIDAARERGESLGGVFEIWCWEVCPGVGGYASLSERLDGRLMGALGSIPAIKGVEVGPAFENAQRLGSEVHDALHVRQSERGPFIYRGRNRSGGLEGGMTNGMPIVVRAAMKPIPTMTTPLPSVDLKTLKESAAHYERSDVCAVPAARVVGEAMVAYVLAQAYVEKFGGDSVEHFTAAVRSYERELETRGLWCRASS